MIELKGVAKQYLYGARVLGGTELSVADGEVVALLGDSGSGKTTLLKLIAGVTDCEGEVLICGAPVSKRPDDVLMVFDDLAVFKNRTFYYNLAYPLKIRGVDKGETDRLVKSSAEIMGITACLYEKVSKMPLIDVKRLAIARLFIRDYKALLIDDITAGLSREEADILWREVAPIILKKAREGVSVIYATSSRAEAISISDRIAVLHYGELKQIAPAKIIYENPSNIWAAEALDAHYRFERARIENKDGRLTLYIGSPDDEYALDGEVFRGKLAYGYENKPVFAGWHSDDFAEDGERREAVEYAIAEGDCYILHTSSGVSVKNATKKDTVCTLPNVNKVKLFDYTNENDILIGGL